MSTEPARSTSREEEAPTPSAGREATLDRLLARPLPAPLTRARELTRPALRDGPQRLPTSLAAFDRLLSGGLPRGHLVELVGRRSSGRFSIALGALAAATAAGEAAALVDLGAGLDPQTAAATGADLDRLLWVRARRTKEALVSAELLLKTGFTLVVVDLGSPPVAGGRGAQGAWLRLARAAAEQGSALLVSSPYRMSGAAAATVVQARGGRPRWRGRGATPRLLEALEPRLLLEKLDSRPIERAADLRLATWR